MTGGPWPAANSRTRKAGRSKTTLLTVVQRGSSRQGAPDGNGAATVLLIISRVAAPSCRPAVRGHSQGNGSLSGDIVLTCSSVPAALVRIGSGQCAMIGGYSDPFSISRVAPPAKASKGKFAPRKLAQSIVLFVGRLPVRRLSALRERSRQGGHRCSCPSQARHARALQRIT
jgi:hypothetical protein